jgi:hypothetical protein
MDKEHYEEWHALERRARDVLKKGSDVEEIGIRRILQVVEMPSFRPASSWEIFEKNSRSTPSIHFAICLRWRHDLDSQKFQSSLERLKHPRSLDPTIETRRIALKASFVTEACSKLNQISVPVYTKVETVGCDGTSFEFAFGDSFLGARFAWWEAPSGPLKPLAEETRRILKDLEAL